MNLPTFADKPDTHNDKYFEDLLMEAEYLKMDTETQAQYERRVKEMRDAKNVEEYARNQAIAEGREEGLAKGRAEGIALTLKALSLLNEGKSVQDVYKLTGLSEDIVSTLYSRINSD